MFEEILFFNHSNKFTTFFSQDKYKKLLVYRNTVT